MPPHQAAHTVHHLTLTQPGGTLLTGYFCEIYTNSNPGLYRRYSCFRWRCASGIGVPVSGAGVNSAPSLTADAATNISYTSATLPATVTDNGCTAITSYGFEYSTTMVLPTAAVRYWHQPISAAESFRR